MKRLWACLAALNLGAAAMAQDLSPFLTSSPVKPTLVRLTDPSGFAQPFAGADVQGLLTFRGNASRSFHGTGPLPHRPELRWRRGPFCAPTSIGGQRVQWCGSGWTGQPLVREGPQGTEVILGAFDRAVHFFDAGTGDDIRPPYVTGDIIKGTVSLDPSGAPLLAVGSRDDHLHLVRLDADQAVQLWSQTANEPGALWNNDWDSSPLFMGDILFAGSENSHLYVFRLNRSRDAHGHLTVAPERLNRIRGWDAAQRSAIGDSELSIENSPMALNGWLWFANSGGLVQAHDMQALINGRPRAETLRFRYEAGDDVDASLLGGPDGEVYVAVEDERRSSAAKQKNGQLFRLDPGNPDPLTWSLHIPGLYQGKGGLWASPARYKGVLYAPMHVGGIAVVDAATGDWLTTLDSAAHAWSSPVVIGDRLLVGGCDGRLQAFSIRSPRAPRPLWEFHPPEAGCWESTPAVWKGTIYIGNRNGYVYAIGEAQSHVTLVLQ